MSFLHFCSTTFRLRNIGMFFFLIVNLSLILCPLGAFFVYAGLTIPAIVAIMIFVTAAYYAIIIWCGEVILRIMFSGNRIEIGNSTDSVSTSFMEAYRDAKEHDPSLSDNIRLYICSERYVDAFAFGRRTILLTEPATRLSPEDLKVLLLEKFAQISNNDSDRIQLLIAGNVLFVVFVFLIKTIVYISVALIGIIISFCRFLLSIFFHSRGSRGGFFEFSAYLHVCRVLSNAVERILMFFFNLFVRLALLSIRSNYYINDHFICDCGQRDALCRFLEFTAPDVTGFNSTLGTISAAKPPRLSRLSRISSIQSNPLTEPSTPTRPAFDDNPPASFPQPATPVSRFVVIANGQADHHRFRVVDRHDPNSDSSSHE